MVNESKIKWKRSDYLTLGRAVASFNKKINELNAEDKKLYLPELKEYSKVKQNITTRKELNRVINSLRRFKKEGAEELYTTKAGEQITRWERQELSIQSRIAKNRLNQELRKLNIPNQQGITRIQMGSIRGREIEAQIKNLNSIEYKKGWQFNRLRERIENIGTADFNMKRSIVFRENYIKEMEKYSHLDNYDILMKKLRSIQNPIAFFDFVSKDEITIDLTYQSDQYYSQQAFNSFIQRLGIDINIDSISEDIEN